ncbi:MAG TPA: RHS repeat-associated core domain-containing protein [Candidatus Acidoferrales bacterium]|nr:RHS repeat-associated core domain-containing protein [Candidatus Acidoferrales bacterium]
MVSAKNTPSELSRVTTDYVYDLEGHAIAEVSGSGGWSRGEVFAGGKHIATYANSTTYFSHADWLGSERVRSDMSGAPCETISSLPFGDGQSTSGSCGDPSTRHFTDKERDPESGNDYFGARYYSSNLGRWLTPDWSASPSPVPYAKLTDPQSLNLYAMAGGNPETFADLDGHEAFSIGTNLDCHMSCGCPHSVGVACELAKVADAYAGEMQMHIDMTYSAPPDPQPEQPTADSAGQQQTQNQNQQKYDPSKSGPEDPTNPGNPLSQNPVVKKASDEAFMKTMNGTARGGLAEAGFSVEYKDGKISIANKVDSVNSDKEPNKLSIKTDANTIATLHTHGNKAAPTPSSGDRNPNVQVPNFVRSQRSLYVTIPHSASGNPPLNGYIQLQ